MERVLGDTAESAEGNADNLFPGPCFEIEATLAPRFGFATHQCAVPVLRQLSVRNLSPDVLRQVVLELVADPPMLSPRTWHIDAIDAGGTAVVADRDLGLNGDFLFGLAEAVSGRVAIRLRRTDAGEVLAEREFPVEAMARNQWGGAGVAPELLAAFVQPNDPAVDRLLKSAAAVLRAAGLPDGLDGYERKSRSRSYELASAIWSAVVETGLTYALPPANFEVNGQKVRSPSIVRDGGLATCLDTALLFASALEQAGLDPLVVLVKDHAFAGVWLQPQRSSALLTEDASELRKALALKEMVVFETTLATGAAPAGFARAMAEAERLLHTELDGDFVFALDVRRARMQRLRPLALPSSPAADGSSEDAPAPAPRFEPAPPLPAFDVRHDEPVAATPEGRLARWQRKLLDLSVRNRLLNVKPGPTAIPLVCPDLGKLEDRLAEGRTFRLVALPVAGAYGRDDEQHRSRAGESIPDDYAASALDRDELPSPVEPAKLEAQLVELYRRNRSDLAEGGANTLYLAVGFLRWRKSDVDDRTYRAPLILLPVKLDRRSVRAGVRLSLHEDEPRFNATLLEMLKQDFNLEIPELAGPLPTDGSGIDVALVLDRVRRAVRDSPGFEVVGDVLLGVFSFAKFLMWKDLAERTAALKANRVVRHLLDTPREPFARDCDPPRPEDLDVEISPAELFTPLPGDSSQLAAVVGSARGCDFVLDGPPGTGKSQTIANIIAHNLALGRRVLFVAEKRVALDVVHKRLRASGLGPFCLELHSNKAAKLDVLRQLDSAWTAAEESPAAEWDRQASALRAQRDALNRVVASLHRRHQNGLTIHRAMGLVIRDGGDEALTLDWPQGVEHDEDDMAALREAARTLDLTRPAAALLDAATFRAVDRTEWSNAWQADLLSAASALAKAAGACAQARIRLLEVTSLRAGDDSACLRALAETARLLPGAHGIEMAFAFGPGAHGAIDAAREAIPLLAAIASERAALPAAYPADAERSLPLDDLEARWARASRGIWPFTAFKRRAVARAMAPSGGKGIEPGRDLPRLRRLRTLALQVEALSPRADWVAGWSGSATEPTKLQETVELASGLRQAAARASADPAAFAASQATLVALLGERGASLAEGSPAARAATDYVRAHDAYEAACVAFEALTSAPMDDGPGILTRRQRVAEDLRRDAPGLRAWISWRRSCRQAAALGLGGLVDAMEAGAIPAGEAAGEFETAYARWWAARAIDAEPVLRDFGVAEHADRISRFRGLDDELTALTGRYIRARLCGAIPPKDTPKPGPGFAVLQRQLQLQRRHKPVRQLVAEMGPALTTLAPCLLMSPLAIAQYLPAEAALFDLVIFDEASQITPWDAVGAIARGRQVIVAGDPKQMPPTSFFARASSDPEDLEAEVEEDQESILDECLAAALPQRQLTWHYRSLNESLIAFSNLTYYGGNLVTFPAPVTRNAAVSLVRVNGVWSRGKTRTNQAEAEAIVAEVVRRLTDPAFVDAAGRPLSIAVITLNAEQQRLVEDLLDRARQARTELEPWFAEESAEPVIVKNLETVQGDERDLVLLGIGYGPETPGAPTMPMNFGPLNRKGGWRRLNVAITRARREMKVFCSFDPHMIDLNRTSADAVRDLRHFLEFAERGPGSLGQRVAGSLGGYDSPFEQAVAEGLRDLGWSVVTQVGVSRFRIDLGVVHPDRPGDFLCGVECDGATYHSAATARDRDKVRQAVLRQLGWTLARVWSTDWWMDRRGALARLDAELQTFLRARRELDADDKARDVPTEESVPSHPHEETPTFQADVPGGYRLTSFEDERHGMAPERFPEADYTPFLRSLVAKVVHAEAPIRDDLLVERIARAHGFKRSGRLIRERVLSLASEMFPVVEEEPGGATFVWADPETRRRWNSARQPATAADVRGIEDVPFEELRASLPEDTLSEESLAAAARFFGIRRLTQQARARLLRSRDVGSA